MRTRDRSMIVAVIGGAAVIIAALIGIVPRFWHSEEESQQKLVIAGTVVDDMTNAAIGQAIIHLSGRTEAYYTEDNGNFRIPLRLNTTGDDRVRVYVTKDGYRPFDEAVSPPVENLIVPLHRK